MKKSYEINFFLNINILKPCLLFIMIWLKYTSTTKLFFELINLLWVPKLVIVAFDFIDDERLNIDVHNIVYLSKTNDVQNTVHMSKMNNVQNTIYTLKTQHSHIEDEQNSKNCSHIENYITTFTSAR